MKKKIEINEVCQSCRGTGLYVGMAEREGIAVQCQRCRGTGCYKYTHEYADFVARKDAPVGIIRVLEHNPGIGVGVNSEFPDGSFGGMPIKEWESGLPFPPGSEMRKFCCPAWWYQSVDYKKKPRWEECLGCGTFSGCNHFENKNKCWDRWDREQSGVDK